MVKLLSQASTAQACKICKLEKCQGIISAKVTSQTVSKSKSGNSHSDTSGPVSSGACVMVKVSQTNVHLSYRYTQYVTVPPIHGSILESVIV